MAATGKLEHAAVVPGVVDAAWLAEKLLPAYGLGGAACRFFTLGVNDTYEVVSSDDRYMLRVYRAGWRTLDDIAWELDLLDHLAEREVPVSRPISAADGARVVTLGVGAGERHAVLFSFAPGAVRADADDYATNYGAAAARLHNAMDDFRSQRRRFPIDLAHLVDEPLSVVLPYFSERPADADYVTALAARVRAALEDVADELEQGPCHGDLHGGNAHRADDGTTTFFDFDCGGPGWRAYELAVFRWSTHARRLQFGDDTQWNTFLGAYREHRSFSAADADAVPLFIAARHLWLMGLHAYLASVFGSSFLFDALDRHIKIFRQWEEHLAPWASPDPRS